MARLSAQEVATYHREGYLIPGLRLSAERVAYLRGILDRLIRDNPGVRPEKLVSAHIDGVNAEGVRGNRAFLDLAMEPDILDLVEQVIGPDIILWGCHVFCKPAGDGLETPFHQDGHYWPIRPLATCTVWVALDPSTRANGCLRVIPGSHRDATLQPHLHEDRDDLVLTQRARADSFDEAAAVDLELEPGQMSMHDVYMIHGATVNHSTQRRTGVALRYMPGSSVLERNLNPADGQTGIPVQWAKRPLWLLRGQDRTGRNDFRVGHAPG
ncbi:MAG: phytanoyl-CoA dioxygenase family protein [Lautropia sp.]